MKIKLVCLILAATVLASCGPVHDRRTLNEVEAMMPERPDSALAVLRGMKPRDLPGLHVRPLHALLLSEALDKNYIDLTDDSLALAANRYYGGHGTKLHRLKSWYYLGRIRYNSGNSAEAVICYDKALAFAEELENYHYLGLINRESANSYAKVWDDYHAIEYMQKSIEAFCQGEEDNYAEYSKLALARLYFRQKNNVESNRLLDELRSSSENQYILASVSDMKAVVALSDGSTDYDEILQDYLNAGIGTVLPATAPRLSEIALVYQLKGESNLSDKYYFEAEKRRASKGDTVVVSDRKSKIEALRGNYEEAYSLLKQSVNYQDSSVYAALRQSVSFYQMRYYLSESRINAMKLKTNTISYGIVIILLTLAALFLISMNRRQREKLINEMTLTAEIRQELSSLKGEKEGMNRALIQLFESRLKILQTLSEQYDILEEKHQSQKREKGRDLSRDEIIASFRDKMRELRKNQEITLSMEETLDAWKDGIMRKFREVFSEDSSDAARMTDEDLALAPYFFSGMNYKTISFITGYSIASLRTRKSRIRQKIQELDDSFSLQKMLFLENL